MAQMTRRVLVAGGVANAMLLAFATEAEAKACFSYLKTRFARAML